MGSQPIKVPGQLWGGLRAGSPKVREVPVKVRGSGTVPGFQKVKGLD